jgi:hypothetical protein
MEAHFMWILKEKYDYWLKKYWFEKTDRATKTSLFDNLCRVHEIAYWFGGPSDKNVSSY